MQKSRVGLYIIASNHYIKRMRMIDETKQHMADVIDNPVAAVFCTADAGIVILKELGRFDVAYAGSINGTLRGVGEPPLDFFNHCGNSILSAAIACAAISLLPEKKHTTATALALGIGAPAVANVTTEIMLPKSDNATPDKVDALYGVLFGAFCTAVAVKKMHQRRRQLHK